MYIVKKLPVLLPLIVAVVLCAYGIYYKYDLNEISIKLIVSIIVFYISGYYLREFILKFLMNSLVENERKAQIIKEYEIEHKKHHVDN